MVAFGRCRERALKSLFREEQKPELMCFPKFDESILGGKGA